jgi:hypothetical protein
MEQGSVSSTALVTSETTSLGELHPQRVASTGGRIPHFASCMVSTAHGQPWPSLVSLGHPAGVTGQQCSFVRLASMARVAHFCLDHASTQSAFDQ